MIICAHPPGLGGVVSRFGLRRGRVTGALRQHAGVDIRARRGDPLFAVCDGTIVKVGHDEPHGRREGDRFVGGGPLAGYGNCVVIRSDEGDGAWFPFTAHMEHVVVREGQRVRRGAPIGAVGATSNGKFDGSPTSVSPGRPMGPHAHFEVGTRPQPHAYGRYVVDPVPWLAERGVTYALLGGAPSLVTACRSGLSGLAGPATSPASTATGSDVEVAGDEYEPASPEPFLEYGPMVGYTLVGVAGASILLGGLYWMLRRA